MRLEELVGKRAVRTQSAWYNDNNEPIEDQYATRGEAFEDDSYTNEQYITILEVTLNGIKYFQHFSSVGEKIFIFNNKYDKGFLDDNWIEWV